MNISKAMTWIMGYVIADSKYFEWVLEAYEKDKAGVLSILDACDKEYENCGEGITDAVRQYIILHKVKA